MPGALVEAKAQQFVWRPLAGQIYDSLADRFFQPFDQDGFDARQEAAAQRTQQQVGQDKLTGLQTEMQPKQVPGIGDDTIQAGPPAAG